MRLETECPSAAKRRHVQHPVGVDGVGAAAVFLGEQSGQAHFLKEVEAVVAGRAVGAQTDVDPFADNAVIGAMPLASLRLELGQWATEQPCWASSSISCASRWTACTAISAGLSRPRRRIRSIGRIPKRCRLSSISWTVSCRWRWIGSSICSAKVSTLAKLRRRRCTAHAAPDRTTAAAHPATWSRTARPLAR
jgi:hypothetical protein